MHSTELGQSGWPAGWPLGWPLAWQIALLLGGALLLALLLRPARREWLREQDDEASPAPRHEDRIDALRTMATQEFSDMLQRVRDNGGVMRGIDLDGEPVLVLGSKQDLASQIEPGTRRIGFGVLTSQRLDVPGELVCERDLFAEGRASVAQSAVVRSLLSLRDVAIGVRARVTGRVHADGRLDVAEGAWLHGEASAGQALALARRTRFVRLHAPVIEFGTREVPAARPGGTLPEYLPGDAQHDAANRRYIVHGDLSVPAGHRVMADLIVGGRLVVHENCIITGSLRADRSVRLGQGVQVEGGIVSPSDIRIADNCRIDGPVMAGTRLIVGTGCVLGTRGDPVSVSAARMRIATGSVVYGFVSARQAGQVVAPQDLQS